MDLEAAVAPPWQTLPIAVESDRRAVLATCKLRDPRQDSGVQWSMLTMHLPTLNIDSRTDSRGMKFRFHERPDHHSLVDGSKSYQSNRVMLGLPRTLASLVIALGMAGIAAADFPSIWHRFHITYARNRAWPEPFTEADARQVVMPFEIMKQNGWRAHNTIGHDLFRRGDGVLMAAGRERVYWIASQAPEARRVVFVLRGETNQETQNRVAAVHDLLQRMELDQQPPQVLVTNIEPASAPGPWAERIHRARLEQLPAPVLPSTSAAGQQGAAQGTAAASSSGGSSAVTP